VLPLVCNRAGCPVVLHQANASGQLTYPLGKSAEPIWRGRVLMRCGPAYCMQGELGSGAAQNRVSDRRPGQQRGFRAQPDADGVLRLQLQQSWTDGGKLSRLWW